MEELTVTGVRVSSQRPYNRDESEQGDMQNNRTISSLAYLTLKGKDFPYSLPSVESGADPGVQAVSRQVS